MGGTFGGDVSMIVLRHQQVPGCGCGLNVPGQNAAGQNVTDKMPQDKMSQTKCPRTNCCIEKRSEDQSQFRQNAAGQNARQWFFGLIVLLRPPKFQTFLKQVANLPLPVGDRLDYSP